MGLRSEMYRWSFSGGCRIGFEAWMKENKKSLMKKAM
jgi:hypothetical protein